jgi:hypothetical protein
MTHHPFAQIGRNGNPESPENRSQTRRFLWIRLLQERRSAALVNSLAVLHGRLERIADLKVKLNGGARDRLPLLPETRLAAAVATAINLKLALTAHLSAG